MLLYYTVLYYYMVVRVNNAYKERNALNKAMLFAMDTGIEFGFVILWIVATLRPSE